LQVVERCAALLELGLVFAALLAQTIHHVGRGTAQELLVCELAIFVGDQLGVLFDLL